MGTPFAEYYYRVRRYPVAGADTGSMRPVDIAPNGGGKTDLCLYRVTAPSGALFLEFVDRMERSFVDLESFSEVPLLPTASTRQFLGEFVDGWSPRFVPAAPFKDCPYEGAAQQALEAAGARTD
jgi:hypothetical protein